MKGKNKDEEDFMKVFEIFWDLLSVKNYFTPTELRVLAFLSKHMRFGGKVMVSQASIARGLDLPPTRISVAIKSLIDKKIITKEKNLMGHYFVLSKELFQKGSSLFYEEQEKKKAKNEKFRQVESTFLRKAE